jgi:hypothetical protein
MGIVVLVLLLLLALMALGWRLRQRRQGDVAKPQTAPAEPGPVLDTFEGKYVATTSSGDPLDRIAVHGLGFRGNVTVVVTETGVLLQIPGTNDLWIPATDVLDLRRATWTIDRVVEKDGLHVIEWTLGDRAVETYLRMAKPSEFEKAIQWVLAKERKAHDLHQ